MKKKMFKHGKKYTKRALACFLSVCLVASLTPIVQMHASAEGGSAAKQEAKAQEEAAAQEAKAAEEEQKAQEEAAAQAAKAKEAQEAAKAAEAKKAVEENANNNSNSAASNNSSSKKSTGAKKPSLTRKGATVSSAADGVCKLGTSSSATTFTYYASLDDALDARETLGGYIYVYKNTTLTKAHTVNTTGSYLVIQNITNPSSDAENPEKNGNGGQPVVTFAKDASITYTSCLDSTLKGLIFDGANESRTTPAITWSVSAWLHIEDGVANTTAGIPAEQAVFKRFNNTTGNQASVFQVTAGNLLLHDTVSITDNGNTSSISSAIYINGGAVTCGYNNGTPSITGNKSKRGGAVYVNSNATFTMMGGTISDNNGSDEGGAIHSSQSTNTIDIQGGTISDNTSVYAGAIFASDTTFKMSDGTIKNNYASYYQPALYLTGTSTISGGEITGNRGGGTGAVRVYGGTLTISGAPKIYGNGYATSKTGAITIARDVDLYSDSYLKVGTLSEGAKIGIYNTGTLCNSGVTFANVSSGTATSVAASLRKAFYNDVNPTYFACAAGTTGTGIKWSEGVCKVSYQVSSSTDPVVQVFESIQAAATYIASLDTSYTMKSGSYSGYFPIEMLQYETEMTYISGSRVVIATGAARPVMFTTASASATDGYPYKGYNGTTTGTYATAVLKWTSAVTASACNPFNFQSASKWTMKNLIFDGNKDNSKYGPDYAAFNISGSSTFIMDSGAVIKNYVCGAASSTNFYGGAAFVGGGSTFQMKSGSKIDNCESNFGGGIYLASPTTTYVTIDGGIISNCKATRSSGNCGGAIYVSGGNDSISSPSVVLTGNTKITNNQAMQGGAISLNDYTSSSDATKIFYSGIAIKGNTEISGNRTTSETYPGAVNGRHLSNVMYSRVFLSGSPKIYDNYLGASGTTQCNLGDNTTTNDGSNIIVQTDGLSSSAKIGVYSTTNYGAGAQFATTAAATASTSTNAKNLSAFINDKNTNMCGTAAASGNGVVWLNAVCKVTSQTSSSTDPVVKVFSSTNDAFTYIKTLSSSDTVKSGTYSGYIPIEMLVENYSQTTQANTNSLSGFNIMMTTASESATDGYPYRGTTGTTATITRASTFTTGNSTFYLEAGNCTIKNLIVDGDRTNGASGTYNGTLLYVCSGATLTLEDGATLQNALTTGSGAAVYVSGAATFNMNKGSLITNCQAKIGGGIYAYGTTSKQAYVNITNGKITECTGTDAGGGLYTYYTTLIIDSGTISVCKATSSCSGAIHARKGVTVTLKGETVVTGCEAPSGGAIFIPGGSDASVYIQGKTKITGNTTTTVPSDTGYAIGALGSYSTATGKYIFSGSPTVYDNTNSSKEQRNVGDNSATNEGSRILVGSDGLNTDAQIGVYSNSNYDAGYVFGSTEAASAKTKGLGRFVNDKTPTLFGVASATNGVMWSDAVCKIETTTTDGTPVYYSTLLAALQAATTGQTITIFKDNDFYRSEGTYSIDNNRTLTLRDETSSGIDWTGTLATTTSTSAGRNISVSTGSTLILDGCRFDTSSRSSLGTSAGYPMFTFSGGTLKIQGDTYLKGFSGSTYAGCIMLGSVASNLIMTGGTITGGASGIFLNGTPAHNVQISGGTITGNSGTTTYSGGVVLGSTSSGATVSISGSAKIYGNQRSGADCNVAVAGTSQLKVGDLNEDAKIGVYSSDKYNSGDQFGTGTKTASTITHIENITNDKNTKLMAGPGSGTAVIWAGGVVKVVVSGTDSEAGTHPFDSIAEAITYINGLSSSSWSTYFPSGSASIEVLVGTLTQTANVTVNCGSSKPVILTTADPTATDGYPYRGVTTEENGRAVVKRGWEGYDSAGGTGSMFYTSNSSNLTVKNLVIDGNKDAYSSDLVKARRGFYLGSGSTLTLDSQAWVRNCDSGKYTDSSSGKGLNSSGAAIYATSASSTYTTKIYMKSGSKISDCSSGGSCGGIYLYNYGTISLDGAEISNCHAGASANGGAIYNLYSRGASISIKDSTIKDCSAYSGGAITSYSSTTLSGSTTITNCKTTNEDGVGSAIYMTADSGYSPVLTIKDNVVITGNTGAGLASASKGTAICFYKDGETIRPSMNISGSPYIYGNTDKTGAQANFLENTASNVGNKIKVTTDGLNADAKIGVYSISNSASGATFAQTAASTASSVKVLGTFVNDITPTLIATAGSGNAVIWADAVCKVVDTETVAGTSTTVAHPYMTINDAVAFINTIATGDFASHFSSGSAKIEMLVAEHSMATQVALNTGASRPVILTTAATDATDGYPYKGTAGTNAVVKRGYDGAAMFKTSDSSKFTVTKVTLDGDKDNHYYTDNGGIISVLGTAGNNYITLDTGAVLQNSKAKASETSGATGGAIYSAYAGEITINSGAVIQNCIATHAGAIYAGSIGVIININGGKITGCSSVTNYGAIYAGGTINMTAGEISSCTNPGTLGGAIYLNGTSAKLNMSGGTIKGNSVTSTSGTYGCGAGVYANNAKIILAEGKDSSKNTTVPTIEGNTASGSGGGVYLTGSSASLTMSGGTIGGYDSTNKKSLGNVAQGYTTGTAGTYGGAGVYAASSATITLSGGEISYNTCSPATGKTYADSGGGIYLSSSTLNMTSGKIENNQSYYSGGGIYSTGGTINASAGSISSNTANHGVGGGIVSVVSAALTLSGSVAVNNNKSQNGGAGVYVSSGTFDMQNGTISGNGATASGYSCSGAGVYISGSDKTTATISGGTISGHSNSGKGAGIYATNTNSESTLTIKQGSVSTTTGGSTTTTTTTPSITGNTSTAGGSAIYYSMPLIISGGSITGNTVSATTHSAVQPDSASATVTVSGNPTIYDNTCGSGSSAVQRNLGETTADSTATTYAGQIKVASTGLSDSAKIGVYSSSNAEEGDIFARTYAADGSTQSTAVSSTNAKNLRQFFNDVDTSLRGVACATGSGVKWIGYVCKVTALKSGTTVVEPFLTIQEAVDYIEGLDSTYTAPTSGDYKGTYPLEMLVGNYDVTESVTFATGSTKPVTFTTASASATDGYKYRGDTTKESGRAVVMRGFAGVDGNQSGAIFMLTGNSNVNVKNIVVDGNKSAYTSVTSNLVRRAFLLNSDGNTLTLDDKSLIRYSDNGKFTASSSASTVRGGAIYAASAKTTSLNYVNMKSGSIITECSATAAGGAITMCTNTRLNIDGGEISKCSAPAGGGIDCYFTDNAQATIKDATITGNTATGNGGGILAYCDITLSGTTTVSGNTASYGSGIAMSSDRSASSSLTSTSYLTLSDSVKVIDNTSTAKAASGGAGIYCAITDYNKVIVSGNVQVSGNKDSESTVANVYENTTQDNGSVIEVATAGLGSSANIGVWSVTNEEALDKFGHTAAASAKASTGAKNLKCFKNDRDSKLSGTWGAGANVIWSSEEWLDLTAILPSTGSVYDESWFVVELKDTITGDTYRQPICVGSKSGGASETEAVAVRGAVPYEVTLKSNNGTWRYTYSSAALAGSNASNDVWTTTVSSGSSANGTLTVNPTSTFATGQHELKVTTQRKSDNWVDEHIGVENTMSASS